MKHPPNSQISGYCPYCGGKGTVCRVKYDAEVKTAVVLMYCPHCILSNANVAMYWICVKSAPSKYLERVDFRLGEVPE